MQKKITLLLLPGLLIFLACCKGNLDDNSQKKNVHPYVSIKGQYFIDSLGRNILFHGINLVNKDPEVNYLGKNDRKAIEKMRSWGFNCLRLGVIWDGLEPEPGIYDEEYLKGIDQRIRWAEENGLYVFLDMHQDLYSVEFSDGAPEWATLDEGKPHITGEVWSEAYMISPAVQTAFDNFWKNTPAPDGVGVQDHFINAWKHVAERYSDNTTVIGYDLMNEPFMGSGASRLPEIQLKAYTEMLSREGREVPPPEELMNMLNSKEGKIKIFESLGDPEKFRQIVDAIYPLQEPFESGVLMDFYQRTRDSIRQVDTNHIVFIEHGIFSNSGMSSAIRPLVDEDGNVDNLVAYAPHGYDLVTDTEFQATSSFDRLDFIFDRIDNTADRLNMPVIVGEWGAFYGNKAPAVVAQADHILSIFEKNLFGNTYWSYFVDLDNQPYFDVLRKPYPLAVNGELSKYEYLYATGEMSVEWRQDETRSTESVFYIPDVDKLLEEEIKIIPGSGYEIKALEDGIGGYLVVDPVKDNSVREIYVRIAREGE